MKKKKKNAHTPSEKLKDAHYRKNQQYLYIKKYKVLKAVVVDTVVADTRTKKVSNHMFDCN